MFDPREGIAYVGAAIVVLGVEFALVRRFEWYINKGLDTPGEKIAFLAVVLVLFCGGVWAVFRLGGLFLRWMGKDPSR